LPACLSWPALTVETWVHAVLRRVGLPGEDAALAAAALTDADRRGLAGHGLARLAAYVARLEAGDMNPAPRQRCVEDGGLLSIDADLGLGQVVGIRAIDVALARLDGRAAQIFLLRRAGHLGALGHYVRRAAEAGKVALLAQVSQPVMAPPGAARAAIGNNPVAFAAPMPDGPPLVVDLSLSRVARGNVLLAARDGTAIPPDWAIGRDGRPTTDPAEALLGAMLPMGDYKGLALAMMVQVLAGSLTGSTPRTAPGQGAAAEVGAFGIIADPARIIGQEAFDAHMADWTGHYLAATGAHGRLPGRAEPADRITPSASVLPELTALGARFGLPFPTGAERDER
jgi:LDH2 family malate/lactate/ureidoglycolate dehydrogenase